MPPRTSRQIAANGLTLHAVEQGEGRPILFLHGFPEYSGAWELVMDALSDRFRTIAIDTRGVGRSDAPDGVAAYKVAELVEDVRACIEALALENLTLVGHDWGGFIAWEFAIKYPELLDKLVVINAAHVGILDELLRDNPEQIAASQYMLAFRSPRGEQLVSRDDFAGFRKEIIEPMAARGALSAERRQEYLEYWNNPKRLSATLNYFRANESGPPRPGAAPGRPLNETEIHLPTLVIWGERDAHFILENVTRLPEVARDVTVRRFPEHSHWIVHEAPAEVAKLIGEFACESEAGSKPAAG